MAESLLDLTHFAKINGLGINDFGATNLLNDAPVLAKLASTPASNGTVHSYVRESGAPTVGYRAVNAGRDHSKSDDEQVTINLKLLDASFTVDTALADQYRGGPAAYIEREALRHLRAAFYLFEQAIWYGTGADAGAFSGLAQDANLDGLADTAHVVNATDNTALTSVWFLRTNMEMTDVATVIGMDGNISISDSVRQRVQDGNSKSFMAYVTEIKAWTALQIGGAYSVARICNIGTTAGKGLTDVLLSKALALFPAGRQPNLICMNRRSLSQLQQSRTTYSPIGQPAPRPTEYEGIPIVVTDSISNAETAVA